MTMERAFFTLLKSVPGIDIGGLTSPRIYAQRAPDNAQAPFVIFQRINTFPYRSINNPSGLARAEIQVDVYGATYYDAKERAEKIQNALDGFRGEMAQDGMSPPVYTKFGGIILQNALETLDETDEPVLHRVTMTFSVTYHY